MKVSLDRPTLALIIGVLGIVILALGVAVWARAGQGALDLNTPEGVATAYILAIQNRQPDEAWNLLASPGAISGPFPVGPGGRGDQITQDAFRQQVLNSFRSGNRRLRVLTATTAGNTARVEVEVTTVASDPFRLSGGDNPQTRTFELARSDVGWRITTAPPIFDLL